jgi:hypothetical protein
MAFTKNKTQRLHPLAIRPDPTTEKPVRTRRVLFYEKLLLDYQKYTSPQTDL